MRNPWDAELGAPDRNDAECQNPRDTPVWSINNKNMNTCVPDIPLCYQPALGLMIEAVDQLLPLANKDPKLNIVAVSSAT